MQKPGNPPVSASLFLRYLLIDNLLRLWDTLNIDIAPTVMVAMGLEKPPHMDGANFIPRAQGKEIPWRDYFL
ncbi:MAG: hypothetical protein J6386_00455 [Candidatus Synoicihabitans palmerolidicus]|nr:hypothetical protein [Candidatus Synoicihabitans palmerolidicus]